VEVLPDGKPGRIIVVKAGPASFTRRAIDCARRDARRRSTRRGLHPGEAEFSIGFLN
jgi:hypothetical protein